MHNYTANKSAKFTCSVVGARGYTGLETVRLLLNHPHAELTHCFATSTFQLSQYISVSSTKLAKQIQNITCLPDSEIMSNLTDVVFLATPAEVSMELAPKILSAGKKVIDLSGAFRLKNHDYKKWYNFEHSETTLLEKSVYGLVPWMGPWTPTTSSRTSKYNLIANPGCYATAISLALIPLLKKNVIAQDMIVIDAKSGTSGGGRKASENLLFTEVDSECLPYKVGEHQHLPEIIEAVEMFSGKKISPHFTTSLLPTRRGIIAGIYANLSNGKTLTDVEMAFAESYNEFELISTGPLKKESHLLSLKKVLGTGKTHISYHVVDEKLYVFSCIDNLMKGAASQAIENFNCISDLPISTGLSHLEAII